MEKIKSVFLFTLTFGLGFAIFFSYSTQATLDREPASIGRKIFQLKNYDHDQLKQELTTQFQVINLQSGEKFIRFNNLSSQVCKQYQNLQILFIAEGMSVAGEPTTMTIDSPCLPAQDPAELASIQIPVTKILSQKPTNATFNFDGSNAKFIFSNASDAWPKTWILRSVVFKNNNGDSKVVHLDTLLSETTQPKVIEF